MLNFVFLTTSLSTTFIFLKSTGTVFTLPASKSSTFVFKLFNLAGTLTSLGMSNLSTSIFKSINFLLAAKSDVSMPVSWSNSLLVAKFYNSKTTLTLSLIWLSGSR